MEKPFTSFLLFIFLASTVKCIIPNLSVNKVDIKVIQRKRQDTQEVCRIFNEQTDLIEKISHNEVANHNRVKRDIGVGNPALNVEDMKRVEGIVEKLYDDMEEKGQKVSYRQRIINDTKEFKNNSRRFNFAPAELLGPQQEDVMESRPLTEVIDKVPWIKKWHHGIVPYFIDVKSYDAQLMEVIVKAFEYFEKATCIRLQRLRERPVDKKSLQNAEWLYITNPSGIRQCVHSNENKPNSGVQMVVIGYDCMSLGEIVHEVMHILGFSHEHTRPDRDSYITILWDNIKPGYKKYFAVREEDPLLSLPYDYASVLHYPSRAFSKNGQITIMAKLGVKIGQREALSETDIEKVSIVYNSECTERNKDYLLETCPSVINKKIDQRSASADEIKEYFRDRIWPYGIVNYKIRDEMEFTTEEKENIEAVLKHIERETCIEFRNIKSIKDAYENDESNKRETTDNVDADESTKKDEDDDKILDSTTTSETEQNTTLKPTDVEDNEIKMNDVDGIGNIEILSRKGELYKRVKRNVTSPRRRHAANIITLVRSTTPGCECPLPGRPNGNKVLSINNDCFNSVNELLHLFVHVLGLDHQHNMYDRDSFLKIMWNKLTKETKEEMENKLPPAASAGFAYDYQSVMHYPWLQIKNGVTNIMYPIWNDGWAMGHWQGLSFTDVQKLNHIYNEQCKLRSQSVSSNN